MNSFFLHFRGDTFGFVWHRVMSASLRTFQREKTSNLKVNGLWKSFGLIIAGVTFFSPEKRPPLREEPWSRKDSNLWSRIHFFQPQKRRNNKKGGGNDLHCWARDEQKMYDDVLAAFFCHFFGGRRVFFLCRDSLKSGNPLGGISVKEGTSTRWTNVTTKSKFAYKIGQQCEKIYTFCQENAILSPYSSHTQLSEPFSV